ncbi:hypothetical protein [Streptomyces sp. WAC06614]|uniref:hypothetical protein n=1 Tax=Streptomyces sp. WAC06614 TaxID=2487416 RepID=UPI000F7B94B0|nr:hypothetical protein [Streptomyces sp. WAC06614]RSS76789.1 hypothetical protein EF918_22920 [Streptomyces sp. WAC06614]
MTETRAPLRCTRAAMFAAVCTALGAVGHLFMSGRDIPAAGLFGAFAVTAGLAWLGAGRRRGPVSISAALLTVQAVLHLLFAESQAVGAGGAAGGTTAARASAVPPPSPLGHVGHTGHVSPTGHVVHTGRAATAADMPSMPSMPSMQGMPGMEEMAGAAGGVDHVAAGHLAHLAGHGGLGMIAAHVLAGLFCALWLARGERAVFRLARALRALGVRLVGRVRIRAAAVVPASVPRVRRRRYEPPRALRGAVHAHAVVRRGPPVRPFPRATAPGRPACA